MISLLFVGFTAGALGGGGEGGVVIFQEHSLKNFLHAMLLSFSVLLASLCGIIVVKRGGGGGKVKKFHE